MHTVLEGDKDTIDEGKLIANSINQGLGSFTPDLIYETLVKSYSLAEQLYGESIIRQLSGYDARYVKENIRIPEFQRELEKGIRSKIEELEKKGLIEKNGQITEKGLELASIILYVDELKNLIPRGIYGEKSHRKNIGLGEKNNIIPYKRQGYKNLAIRDTLKLAIRRGHPEIDKTDLRAHQRKSRGQLYIIYALDASGSMKGKKIEQSKKAGIALAYRAIEEKDLVGLIVFGERVKEKIEPTRDFVKILKAITSVSASNETNLSETITESISLFPEKQVTKHLLIITDALPTKGRRPEESTLEAVSLARSHGITISIVGIKLDPKGESIAKKITNLGGGRLYKVSSPERLDVLVLEDYYKEMG